MGLLDLLGSLGGAQAGSAQPAPPAATVPQPQSAALTSPQDVVVTATKKQPPPDLTTAPPTNVGPLDTSVPNLQVTPPSAPPPPPVPRPPLDPNAYNNQPELQAINGVRQGYPDTSQNTPGLGQFIPNSVPGAGTLRNLLGTLGDAFLIQSGHQPYHRLQQQANDVAQAAAGFDQDPGAAAARIAATGAPGSIGEAQNMYTAAQNEKLREATLANTQAYRDSVLSDRTQNHQAAQAIAQGKADDRVRSLNGGILAAAAATGDPTKYAAARAAAIARIPQGSSITADEYPTDPHDFNAGYGLNANQYNRDTNAAANTAQRGQLGQENVDARNRGISVGAQNNNRRVAATYAGQATTIPGQLKPIIAKVNQGIPLQPGEQALYDKQTHIPQGRGGGGGLLGNIPGVGGAASPAPSGNVPTHTYPSGRVVQYIGGQWKEIHH